MQPTKIKTRRHPLNSVAAIPFHCLPILRCRSHLSRLIVHHLLLDFRLRPIPGSIMDEASPKDFLSMNGAQEYLQRFSDYSETLDVVDWKNHTEIIQI